MPVYIHIILLIFSWDWKDSALFLKITFSYNRLTASSTRHVVLPIFVSFCDAQIGQTTVTHMQMHSLFPPRFIVYTSFPWILQMCLRYRCGPYLMQSVYHIGNVMQFSLSYHIVTMVTDEESRAPTTYLYKKLRSFSQATISTPWSRHLNNTHHAT